VKTILVTGASSGIGRALTVRAARAGYAVYAVGRNIKALAALGAQVAEEGGIIRTDVTDISNPANAPSLIGRMLATFGHVDILVNNAGTVAIGPIAAQSDDQLLAQFGTHVVGPLALVREALPSLRATRGHVFMLGSGVARVPVGGLGAYPPSKAALRSATAILRRELTPLDIAVTYVDPGAVDTAFMTRAGLPGAPASVLVSPEVVARKILLAIGTRPRVLNVAPLQTAAVAVAAMLPGITEAILERNPQLVGSGPQIALNVPYDNGRSEKMALPASVPLLAPDEVLDDEIDDDLDVAELPVTPPVAVVETVAADVMPAPPASNVADETSAIPTLIAAPVEDVRPPARWKYEPPEADDAVLVESHAGHATAPAPAEPPAAAASDATDTGEEYFSEDEAAPEPSDDEPAHATTSFDAALEPLRFRMERSKLPVAFIRDLLVPDAVLDVSETALRWAGMPNKHERSLTSEIFFALAEWGFLAPRADGRYRVLRGADDPAPL
jgi:short-subunit dehydrogenase